jgi:hypothetical protein
MHEPGPRQISRKDARRGLRVEAQFSNGDKLIGWLHGWGKSVIRVRTSNSAVAERAVTTLARVIEF